MSKYYGAIGFAETVETKPGVYEEQITEKFYKGDMRRNTRRLQASDSINDNIIISNELYIIADDNILDNINNIRYLTYKRNLWKITDIRIEEPKLILTIGGLYNVEPNQSAL